MATAPTQAQSSPEFVRPRDVAARYGVTTRTVLNWIAAGTFPAVRRGRTTRIRMPDVIAALERQTA